MHNNINDNEIVQPESVNEKPELPPVKNMRKIKLIIFMLLTLCIFIFLVFYFYYETTHYVSTNDAMITGNPVYICPNISGYVKEVYVSDNEHVKTGDILARIDDRTYQLQLQEAQAQLDVAKAKLDSAKALYGIAVDAQNTAAVDMHRNQILMAGTMMGKAVSQENFEHTISLYEAAVSEVKSAEANIKLAQANLNNAKVNIAEAELNLSYTKIYAEQNGYITRKTIEIGSYVNAGNPVMAIVSDDKWIIANFKETQLTHMKAGQGVDISIDAYPGIKFNGKVQSLQAGTGSAFSLLPPENATGNYVKVVQRIPVKITFDKLPDQSKYFLAIGMSVEPTVKIK